MNFKRTDPIRAQQVPPQPTPGDTPVPPRPTPTRPPSPVEDPGQDPTQRPPPVQDPDVVDPTPSPQTPPMIAANSF